VPLDTSLHICVADYSRPGGPIIIPNPNAPTGIALSSAEIAALLDAHPEQPVVVDEAYVDFGAETAIPLISVYPNLLVVQTMSKSRALVGLRIGYAIGDAGLIEALIRVKNSFNSAPLGDHRMRCDATLPASPIRHRAGTSRAMSWPRSNGIRASCTTRVGFIVSNLSRSAEGTVAFYNQRGRCEQHIKEGKNAIKWTRPSCRTFTANAVSLQLHALAYNLGNFMRTLAMPNTADPWSLTSLREKLIKIGAKVVSHGRYVTFQMAEVAVPRQMFAAILSLIARLRAPPAPA